MQKFRYIADGVCPRFWPPSTVFTFSSVAIEFLDASSESGVSTGWTFIAYSDVQADTLEDALQSGRSLCLPVIDLATLVSGYAMRVISDGVRAIETSDRPGLLEVPASAAIRTDKAADWEHAKMESLLAAAEGSAHPGSIDPVVRNGLRWYARAVEEFEPMDRYIKLFTVLDMFVPPNTRGQAPRSFASRARVELCGLFGGAVAADVEECCSDLASVRNKLIHDGVLDKYLPAATQILERLVRAILRRKVSIPEEFAASEVFLRIANHPLQQEGLAYGWLGATESIDLKMMQFPMRVGDPDHVDGRHVMYAREAGVEVRLFSNFRLG